MERLSAIGGVFLGANDQAALLAWYRTHLGLEVKDHSGGIHRVETVRSRTATAQ